MTTSSVQDISSITFVDNMDTITLNDYSGSSTITIDPSYNYAGPGATVGGISGFSSTYSISPGITVGSLTTSQISTLSNINIDTSSYKINLPEEWVNCFPDFNRIEKMCKEYPGLAIAFEKFKTTYKLVRDHYDTPEDKRPRP